MHGGFGELLLEIFDLKVIIYFFNEILGVVDKLSCYTFRAYQDR